MRTPAALLTALLLLPALAACGDSTSVRPGDTVPARDSSQFAQGAPVSLTLPIGRLEVYLGTPTRTLRSADTLEPDTVEAPEGETFVPITWQYDAASFGDLTDYLGDGIETAPKVAFVADGASYRLPAPEARGEGAESFYVLVEGDGRDVSLKVDFDGVTQSLDLRTGERDTGAAAPLYDLDVKAGRARSCAADTKYDRSGPGKTPTFACTITPVLRLPYAAGQWAPEGSSWLTTTITTTLSRYDEIAPDFSSGGTYYATGVTPSFTLGGTKAVAALRDGGSVCPDATTAACTTTYHVVFADPGKGAANRRFKATETFDLKLGAAVVAGQTAGGPEKLTATVTTRLR